MPDVQVPSVALQVSSEPTNKVAAATNAAGGVGAVLAGAIASYGDDSLRAMFLENWPSLQDKTETLNFMIFILVTVLSFLATKYAGRIAAWNVLDKPNAPVVATLPPPAVALPAPVQVPVPVGGPAPTPGANNPQT